MGMKLSHDTCRLQCEGSKQNQCTSGLCVVRILLLLAKGMRLRPEVADKRLCDITPVYSFPVFFLVVLYLPWNTLPSCKHFGLIWWSGCEFNSSFFAPAKFYGRQLVDSGIRIPAFMRGGMNDA